MSTLTLEKLRVITKAGAVAGVTLKAQGGAFIIFVDTYKGEQAVLAKARSCEPRYFSNPLQALMLLHTLGLVAGSFDVEQWNPDEKARIRTRPDRTEALKRTHEAADHDKWFREQVEQGLVDANDPNTAWVTHEVAKENMQRQREALQECIAGKTQ